MPTTRSSRFQAAPLLPLALDASLEDLQRLRELMAAQGWRVSPARMCLDRVYARECFAQAHTSADESLRALAVALFERCAPDHGNEGLRR